VRLRNARVMRDGDHGLAVMNSIAILN